MSAQHDIRERIASYREGSLRARIRGKRKRRGVALIMSLAALVILTAFLTQMQVQTSASMSAALADRDALVAEYNAKSGINLARMLIATEPAVRRALTPVFVALLGGPPPQIPVWKFSDKVLGPFNDAAHQEAFTTSAGAGIDQGKNLGLTKGYFELRIVEEDSKLNVNAAVSGDAFTGNRFGAQFLGMVGGAQYNEMFEHEDADGQFHDRPTICGALLDFSDYDEKQYMCDPFGNAPPNEPVEDNYYGGLGLGYFRKNAPYDSLDELRLVRGINDEFWNTFIEPNPQEPEERAFTVWGQEKVNVNSASALTLLAIVCGDNPEALVCTDPLQMSSFITGITLARSFLQGMPLFQTPRQFVRTLQGRNKKISGMILAAMGIEPITFRSAKNVEKSISTDSKFFSIYADGVVPSRNRTARIRIHAVVDFRSAAELGGMTSTDDPDNPSSSTSSGTGAGTEGGTTTAPTTPEDIVNALASDPAGSIVYYRVE